MASRRMSMFNVCEARWLVRLIQKLWLIICLVAIKRVYGGGGGMLLVAKILHLSTILVEEFYDAKLI